MSKIPIAAIGAVCTLVLAVAIIGGGITMDAGLIFQMSSSASTSTGGEYECEVEDSATLHSAIVGNTGWDDPQVEHATIVYLTAAERGLGDHGAIIGLITAYQESRLYNYANFNVPESRDYDYQKIGEDHDSLGIFQQRPSAGWGTVAQLMSPDYAAGKFYDKLVTFDWESMAPGDAAQAVQVSAFPNAYANHIDMATTVIEHFKTYVTCTPVGGEWTHPVPDGTFWGGYRTGERPGHDGVDIGADKGSEIVAASAGTVIRSKCDAQLGGSDYSCDIDGSASVSGCGWYVDIEHADRTATRYCHMMSQPLVDVGDAVTTGQLIGYVGSSGNSGAPHLHFETHTAAPATSSNATEPIAFMSERDVDVS